MSAIDEMLKVPNADRALMAEATPGWQGMTWEQRLEAFQRADLPALRSAGAEQEVDWVRQEQELLRASAEGAAKEIVAALDRRTAPHPIVCQSFIQVATATGLLRGEAVLLDRQPEGAFLRTVRRFVFEHEVFGGRRIELFEEGIESAQREHGNAQREPWAKIYGCRARLVDAAAVPLLLESGWLRVMEDECLGGAVQLGSPVPERMWREAHECPATASVLRECSARLGARWRREHPRSCVSHLVIPALKSFPGQLLALLVSPAIFVLGVALFVLVLVSPLLRLIEPILICLCIDTNSTRTGSTPLTFSLPAPFLRFPATAWRALGEGETNPCECTACCCAECADDYGQLPMARAEAGREGQYRPPASTGTTIAMMTSISTQQ
jgi:hypothetical protein